MAALLHGLLLMSLAFKMKTPIKPPEPVMRVMKLMDIREEIPPPVQLAPPPKLPPPAPPTPPKKLPVAPAPPEMPKPVEPQETVVETVAENMIETDEVPEDQVVVSSLPTKGESSFVPVQSEPEYLLPSKVSKIPSFSDQDLRAITTYLRDNYPPIALRSSIEGRVILDMFIDSRGIIRQIKILREEPEGRGFGKVAVDAFKGIRASPGEANGVPVSVQFRYPIRFTVK